MEFMSIVFKSFIVVILLFLAYYVLRTLWKEITEKIAELKNNDKYGEVEGTIVKISSSGNLYNKHAFLYNDITIEKEVNGEKLTRILEIAKSDSTKLKVGQKIRKIGNKIIVIE